MVQHLPSQKDFTSEQLLRYMDLFVGRSDDCALQTNTGRYVRTGRPLTRQEITEHLRGKQTLATYVIDERGCCRFCVFDDDTGQDLHRLTRLQSRLISLGYPTYLEASRRGGHLFSQQHHGLVCDARPLQGHRLLQSAQCSGRRLLSLW